MNTSEKIKLDVTTLNRDGLTLKLKNGELQALYQTLLPHQEVYLKITSAEEMSFAIKRLAVRGAPLIGVAAGMGLLVEALKGSSLDRLKQASKILRASRPTAVNLMNILDRFDEIFLATEKNKSTLADVHTKTVNCAMMSFDEDVLLCEKMAQNTFEFVPDDGYVITYCNAGALATAGLGTALGALKYAFSKGKKIHVISAETRPLLQGARLSVWELHKAGIPHTLVCDNMLGAVMRTKKIKGIYVGADRIAANGDVANKIGTYNLAILAKEHNVPLYVIAPSTTLDLNCKRGEDIEIEERDPAEIIGVTAMKGTPVWNPAFDMTPNKYIARVITEESSKRF
jgi:methylthioribose-1-phosphate isomerase